MKLILVSIFLIGLSFAQTRPTGGPDVRNFTRDEDFKTVVSLIETAVEMNFDECQTGMIRPGTFSIKEIYQMLNSMYVLNYISRLNVHEKHSPIECDETIMKLTPQMICLIKGTESSFKLLSSYRRGSILIMQRFNIQPAEAHAMMDFFNTINISKQNQTIYR